MLARISHSKGSTQHRSLLEGRLVRVLPAMGLTVGLALGGYGIASATTSPSSSASGSSGSSGPISGASAGRSVGSSVGAQVPARHPGRRSWGMPGRRVIRGFAGTLTTVDPTSVTVSGPAGRSRTFTTTSSTAYRKGRTAVSRDALSVGELVVVRASRLAHGDTSTAGNPTAAAVDIVSPRLAGTVLKVSNGSITISDFEGMWRTVKAGASTTYTESGKSVPSSDVKIGAFIVATGSVDADHTELDAATIRIVPPGSAPKRGSGGRFGPGPRFGRPWAGRTGSGSGSAASASSAVGAA